MVEEAAASESAGKSFRERDEEGFRESEVTFVDFYLLCRFMWLSLLVGFFKYVP